MLPSLTPLAGEFLRQVGVFFLLSFCLLIGPAAHVYYYSDLGVLRRDELEALAAMARREINDLD